MGTTSLWKTSLDPIHGSSLIYSAVYVRWLALPLAQWEEDEEYKKMCSIVCNIPVVNDAAERGVKDVQDYANSANDGAYRSKIVVVANSHMVKIPQFLKN